MLSEDRIQQSVERDVIAVVIPSYRVRAHILNVLAQIGPEVSSIYVVDDSCPEQSGKFVEQHCSDTRVRIIFNPTNLGVGGATIAGMKKAFAENADVIVKIDGDGQMDPSFIPIFVAIIKRGEADYAKGNRFFDTETISSMPRFRMLGNACLSFLAKLSTGYWHTFDPTNGFICIHASLIDHLPLEKIANRYFFESDLLFRLNVIGAKVVDIPMHACYGDETSSLKPLQQIPRFAFAHMRNLAKRISYSYFIRDFSLASLELVFGLSFVAFGLVFGVLSWGVDAPATAGTVMVSALPIIVGSQLLLSFLNYDIQSVPRSTLHTRMKRSSRPFRALKGQ